LVRGVNFVAADMKQLIPKIMAVLMLGMTPFAAKATADDADRERRVGVLRDEIENVCGKYLQIVSGDKLHGHSTRELTHVAHDLLALGRDAKEAQTLVERAFAEQQMDVDSPQYGTVPWSVGERAASEDPNAIEFTCLPTGAIMTRYRSQLSPEFIREITPHLHAALAAIRRHNVPVAYTNIYLMKISNLLLLGEAVGDDDAVMLGLSNLDNWIDYTRKNGLAEYNSPTYGETQINSADVAFSNTSNTVARARLGAVLDYLWADACASYYPPTQQVAGASSRDYDFMYGTGPLDRYFYIEGLRGDLPTSTLVNDMSGPFCDPVEGKYRPSARILALALEAQKSMVSGYGPEDWMDRTLYATPAFSVGTAGGPYGLQDREIGIRFGSGRKLPIVSVFLDPFDSPDGSVRVLDKQNHSKPGHIKLTQAIAQDKGAVLAVYDLATNLGKTGYSSLGLDLILPAHTDGLWLDGKKLDDSDTTDHPTTAQSIVVVREGKAALAARMFGVGGFEGFEPVYFLKHDIAKGNAFRLVAYAYQGDKRQLSDKHVPGAVVINVEPCDTDEAFAKFLARSEALSKVKIANETGVWRTTYGPLKVAMDSASDKPIVRQSNGLDVHTAGPARVNGWDLGELLLVGN
jgi:hypothetical protein